jgi:hypothetical protein
MMLAAAPAAAGCVDEPTLEGRAILPADATTAAPFPGIPNTDPAPAPGSTQPVGGFSALNDFPGKNLFLAMPDNGFGNKANSRSFLLRVYLVRADFETARGGDGDVEFDGVGGDIGRAAFELVRPGGRFCAFGLASGTFTQIPDADAVRRKVTRRGLGRRPGREPPDGLHLRPIGLDPPRHRGAPGQGDLRTSRRTLVRS